MPIRSVFLFLTLHYNISLSLNMALYRATRISSPSPLPVPPSSSSSHHCFKESQPFSPRAPHMILLRKGDHEQWHGIIHGGCTGGTENNPED